ncbi:MULTISPECIES: response regulator [Flavobacterium]|uniref:Response regulator n=2 Tax=Flavobacterium TaxID=237 RepID=A0A940XAP5_9FLAO|nr:MULTISPECIES: response regulator [Flavobacterium]MBP4138501.1 response regulator [Flavobacterium geliluteum]MDX6183352.1 response regulator [Flavobacterium sp. Fl-33]MDX6186636.1 response regulator [Flavobacterium sp. Fl-77]UFH38595.1 response regulator [Flavobacterium sp. F-70]
MLKQILCIDDDPITLMLCKKVIAKSEFSNEIITAQNGEEALHHFNTLKYAGSKSNPKKPELIFLDLNMPVMGGWEFLDHFTSYAYSDYNSVNVIVLSSTIDPEDLIKAKKYPIIIDFLSKPITLPMLEYIKKKIDV